MSLGTPSLFGWLLPEALRSLFLVCVGLQLLSWAIYWLPSQGIELATLFGTASGDNAKLATDSRRLAHIFWLGYWALFVVRLTIPVGVFSSWIVSVLGWGLICGLIVLPSGWWLGRKSQLGLSS